MGDRFYEAQKKYKTKRMVKADYVNELNALLNVDIPGFTKLTIDTLDKLLGVIKYVKALYV